MSDLRLTFQDIVDEVAEFLEMGPTPVDRDLDKVKRAVYKGYRRFLYPMHPVSRKKHLWSFLKIWESIQTIDGQWKYALPKNFSNLIGNLVYGDEEAYDQITKVPAKEVLSRRTLNLNTGYPEVFTVQAQKTNPEVGTRWEMWFDPIPSGSYQIKYQYLVDTEKPENATNYFMGNTDALECLQELCLGAAEQQELKTFGDHSRAGKEMLNELILSDSVDTADSLGFLKGTNKRTFLDTPYRRYPTIDIDNVYSD